MKNALLTFTAKKPMAQAAVPAGHTGQTVEAAKAVVLAYKPSHKRGVQVRATLQSGNTGKVARQRQAVAAAR